jgi:hypothetical protein
MRNLAKIVVLAIALSVTAGSAFGADAWQPFVEVTMPGTVVDLGGGWGPGIKRFGARLFAHVVSNCPYQLMASFRGFRHAKGEAVISPADLRVAINGENTCNGARRVMVGGSHKPTPGGVDVPIDLQVTVRGFEYYPAGQYDGVLVITVMATP